MAKIVFGSLFNDSTCRDCKYFNDDPQYLERELKGLTILSSAYGSTRANAGICDKLNLFLEPIRAGECPDFAATEAQR